MTEERNFRGTTENRQQIMDQKSGKDRIRNKE